jgi:hypothetical protein
LTCRAICDIFARCNSAFRRLKSSAHGRAKICLSPKNQTFR